MKKKAVFLLDRANQNVLTSIYTSKILEQLNNLVEIHHVLVDTGNLEEHRELLKEIDVAFSTWGMPGFTEKEIMHYMPALKAVFYAAGSVQAFARPFLNNGITVVSAWAANGITVAEFVVAQIILANKGFYQAINKTKRDYTEARDFSGSFPGNYSTKVGIIGAGMVGSRVIEMLKPYNIEVLVFDKFLSHEDAEKMGVKKCSLAEIFTECQTISNHLANLPATKGILNREYFSCMLKNATFINTGRGAQVVEKDLVEALKDEPARTAVLDVTDPEPPESDSELLKLDNVFLTPHIAGGMNNELERMAQCVVDEFKRFDKGETLKYSVTLKMLETMA